MHDKDRRARTGVLAAGHAVLRSTKADASAAVSKPRWATGRVIFGLKWKGLEGQLANERRAIRANGWGGYLGASQLSGATAIGAASRPMVPCSVESTRQVRIRWQRGAVASTCVGSVRSRAQCLPPWHLLCQSEAKLRKRRSGAIDELTRPYRRCIIRRYDGEERQERGRIVIR